jgi:hypothetical protein
MGALRGDLDTLRRLNRRLRELPTSIAHDVAQRAAPELTRLAREAHAARRSVYGESRPVGKTTGEVLDLEVSGRTARDLRFVSNGTIVRAVLGTPYARFLIGKYSILPQGAIPAEWSARLRELVAAYKVTP